MKCTDNLIRVDDVMESLSWPNDRVVLPSILQVLAIIQPETLVRWHRTGLSGHLMLGANGIQLGNRKNFAIRARAILTFAAFGAIEITTVRAVPMVQDGASYLSRAARSLLVHRGLLGEVCSSPDRYQWRRLRC
jgi:hypothetical protein